MASDREKVEAVAGYIADLKEECRENKESCRAYLDILVGLVARDDWATSLDYAKDLSVRISGIHSFERTRKAYEGMIGDDITAAEEGQG